jgi:diamine N-acetyltransferase
MSQRNIRLETLHVSHLPFIMGWVNDQKVMGYFANRQAEISTDEELRYIETLIASKNDFAFSVFDKDTNEYVGQCSINAIYWPASNGRLFLVITGAQQRKGYAKAILQAVQRAAFEVLRLHKLWLIVREDNTEAQKKYLDAGFQVEGG